MGFVDDISDYRSLAIVGLEKNTGKTECLNYILRRIIHYITAVKESGILRHIPCFPLVTGYNKLEIIIAGYST